jgi:hypothetical protein
LLLHCIDRTQDGILRVNSLTIASLTPVNADACRVGTKWVNFAKRSRELAQRTIIERQADHAINHRFSKFSRVQLRRFLLKRFNIHVVIESEKFPWQRFLSLTIR